MELREALWGGWGRVRDWWCLSRVSWWGQGPAQWAGWVDRQGCGQTPQTARSGRRAPHTQPPLHLLSHIQEVSVGACDVPDQPQIRGHSRKEPQGLVFRRSQTETPLTAGPGSFCELCDPGKWLTFSGLLPHWWGQWLDFLMGLTGGVAMCEIMMENI